MRQGQLGSLGGGASAPWPFNWREASRSCATRRPATPTSRPRGLRHHGYERVLV